MEEHEFARAAGRGGMRSDLPWEIFGGWWRARQPVRGGWCRWERDSLSPKPAHAGSSQQSARFQPRGRSKEKNTHAHSQTLCGPNPFMQKRAESFQIKLWKELPSGGLLTKSQSTNLPAFHLLMSLVGTSPHTKGRWQGGFPRSAHTAS